jgi:hypothetical protein
MAAGWRDNPVQSIASLTPTICDLMKITRPEISGAPPIAEVVRSLGRAGIREVKRCLVYAPDAIGRHLLERCPELLARAGKTAPVVASLQSVFPPKTPVCFASMFTGAQPRAHGIKKYERPVLECDTLFDSLIRSGRKPAIVAVEDSSVDVIFRGRRMDYFSETYDSNVTARVLELLEDGNHDFILAYHQTFDDILHESTPWAPEAMAAAEYHIRTFSEMAAKVFDRAGDPGSRGAIESLVVLAPDHGAHIDPATGVGTHGDDMPEDMEVLHFFGASGLSIQQ